MLRSIIFHGCLLPRSSPVGYRMSVQATMRRIGRPGYTGLQTWLQNSGSQVGVQDVLSCRSLHSSTPSCKKEKASKEQGKEQQAKIAKLMKMVIPETPVRPNRTPEELADAAVRAKEYSRQCMRAMRAAQNRHKEMARLRDEAILNLPLELKMSSLVPVEEDWPMKMLPPFATPPKAPKWRM